jgi:3-isopropylmalate/(R)-2-methylmalate dehydratase large subunit
LQVETLDANAKAYGLTYFNMQDKRQGIVHVIGPEQGLTQPGMTIVCGDSHTTTHGAFGALAFGIGTSEVEHVLATQCLALTKPKAMEVRVTGTLAPGVTAKDLALAVIGQITCAGGTGYTIEFTGETIRGRSSLVAVDDTTIDYLRGRKHAPQGEAWTAAVVRWRDLTTDAGATFDRVMTLDASTVVPLVTWGTRPDMVVPVTGAVPDPATLAGSARTSFEQALAYMGLEPGTNIDGIPVDRVFIGSCTNASRTCARPRVWRRVTTWRRTCARWSCPDRSPSRRPPKPRACTRSCALPASSGANPAARCASA